VVDLLRRATGSSGPFKHRDEAKSWLDRLGGGTGTPSTTDLRPATTPTPTTPAPATGTGGTTPPKTPTPPGADN
jgi:hypothetical protein